MNNQSNRKSRKAFQLFVAGHCSNSALNKQSLTAAFRKICKGEVKVDIPSKSWKGFCFVYVHNDQDREALIEQREVTVKGHLLVVKPHRKGKKLKNSQTEIHSRRVFVRIVSRKPININLESYFLEFGSIECAYVIDSS